MGKMIERRKGKPIIFVRRGPPESILTAFGRCSNTKLEFRAMPSLYYEETSGRGIITPLLERLITVTVSPVAMVPVCCQDTRFYKIVARLESEMRYVKTMPSDYPMDWRRTIPVHSTVNINYDCEDRIGELYSSAEDAQIPFPANLQCICDKDGDYHIVEAK